MQHNTYFPQFDWFPDSRHVAIWGKGKLLKVNMDTGKSEEIPFRVTARHRITTSPRFALDLAPDEFRVRAVRNAVPSPDGSAVAFNALGYIWQQTLPDGKPYRLTQAAAFEAEPVYSPDGAWIAYVEWDDERGGALKLVTASGGEARTLAASSGAIRQPAFSPDGRRVVYRIDEPTKYMGGYRSKPGIYWVEVEGGDSRFVTEKGLYPLFSPDGRRIYYSYISAANDQRFYPTGLSVSKLESVSLDGHDVRAHAGGTDILELKPSPDFRSLAFSYQKQYYVMPFRESGVQVPVAVGDGAVPVTTLTTYGGFDLAWSADSAFLQWTLGPDVYRASVAEQFGEDSPAHEPYASIELVAEADAPEGILAFTNARIITMQDDEVIERGSVVVSANRIQAVGPNANVEIPEGAKVIDATGMTIMPGLVDMHGHIDCCYGEINLMPQKQFMRYAALAFGVTTNFDQYSSNLPSYAIHETNLAGITVGPRAINVGSVVYGRSQKPDFTFAPINNLEDARNVMARKKALGGIVIKSYKQPMRSQRQQLIKAGREFGIMVDAEGESHFYNNISMILDGHVALEHNLPVANYYDDLVQLFVHSDVAHTPTLVIIFGELFGENYLYQRYRPWEDPRIRTYVQEVTSSYSPIDTPSAAPPHVRGMTTIRAADEIWEIGVLAVSRSVKKLEDAGVLINAGSHGQVAGLAHHWEMWLMAEGGMSNHRVLHAGTLNGAKTLGLEEQIGSLEAGKLADLIVLEANPLEDIRNTKSVRYTMVNGRLYDALSMNEIGNYDRPRGKFYWELDDNRGIDWNEAWSE